MSESYISFGFYDNNAKPNSSPQSSDKQDFVDMNELKLNISSIPKIATFEDDFWLLDGSFWIIGEDIVDTEDLGYFSGQMSGSNRQFTTNPKVVITFIGNVSTYGLTIQSPKSNVIDSLIVRWYSSSSINPIATKTITGNTEEDIIITETVPEYNKLEIEFTKTKDPYRFIKVYNISYGISKILDSEVMSSAVIYDECSPISKELAIGTLDFTLYSTVDDFNILNPSGIYKLLQDKQKFEVYYKGDLYGTYYLKDWDSTTDNNFTFHAENVFGSMAETDFDGDFYVNKNAKTLITEIVSDAGFEVEFDDSASTRLSSVTVTGWVPRGKHRDALISVLFATESVAIAGANGKVFVKDPIYDDVSIPYSDLLDNERLKLKSLVTGVVITEHNYAESVSSTTIFNDELPVGSHKLTFESPYKNYVVTGATVVSYTSNTLTVNVQTAGAVTVNADKYNDNAIDVRDDLPSYVKLIPLHFSPAISPLRASVIISR